MRSASTIDAVTVDAFGTLVELTDPVPALRAALADRGVDRSVAEVGRAFRAEVAYYRPRSLEGRDQASLVSLRLACVRVFLEAADSLLEAEEFVDPFVASIVFRPVEGAAGALDRLRHSGLALACVANWDIDLHEHLARLSVVDRFDVVVTSAEAGCEKPDPRIFELALERLDVRAARAIHIGDEAADRDGASAAGLGFEPVPLATLPERLRL